MSQLPSFDQISDLLPPECARQLESQPFGVFSYEDNLGGDHISHGHVLLQLNDRLPNRCFESPDGKSITLLVPLGNGHLFFKSSGAFELFCEAYETSEHPLALSVSSRGLREVISGSISPMSEWLRASTSDRSPIDEECRERLQRLLYQESRKLLSVEGTRARIPLPEELGARDGLLYLHCGPPKGGQLTWRLEGRWLAEEGPLSGERVVLAREDGALTEAGEQLRSLYRARHAALDEWARVGAPHQEVERTPSQAQPPFISAAPAEQSGSVDQANLSEHSLSASEGAEASAKVRDQENTQAIPASEERLSASAELSAAREHSTPTPAQELISAFSAVTQSSGEAETRSATQIESMPADDSEVNAASISGSGEALTGSSPVHSNEPATTDETREIPSVGHIISSAPPVAPLPAPVLMASDELTATMAPLDDELTQRSFHDLDDSEGDLDQSTAAIQVSLASPQQSAISVGTVEIQKISGHRPSELDLEASPPPQGQGDDDYDPTWVGADNSGLTDILELEGQEEATRATSRASSQGDDPLRLDFQDLTGLQSVISDRVEERAAAAAPQRLDEETKQTALPPGGFKEEEPTRETPQLQVQLPPPPAPPRLVPPPSLAPPSRAPIPQPPPRLSPASAPAHKEARASDDEQRTSSASAQAPIPSRVNVPEQGSSVYPHPPSPASDVDIHRASPRHHRGRKSFSEIIRSLGRKDEN